jgi:hypothetical protein
MSPSISPLIWTFSPSVYSNLICPKLDAPLPSADSVHTAVKVVGVLLMSATSMKIEIRAKMKRQRSISKVKTWPGTLAAGALK